jgi:hypothetical protein
MCIGITIVCLPPSVAISGYLFWYQGQKMILTNHYNRSYIAEDEVPEQSFKSYGIGILSLGSAYYVQSLAFPFIEGGKLAGQELKEHALSTTRHYNNNNNCDNNIKNNKQFTVYNNQNKNKVEGRYMPPKNLFELVKRVAPPITLRIAASSFAFFFAGSVQTYIALKNQ